MASRALLLSCCFACRPSSFTEALVHSSDPSSAEDVRRTEVRSFQELRELETQEQWDDSLYLPPAQSPLFKTKAAQVQHASDLNIGSYPHWSSPICSSKGALFCDPDGSLNATAQGHVVALVATFARQTVVTCGQLNSRLAGEDQRTHRPFHVGVALAKEWPEDETDPVSLDHFGRVLLGKWGMSPVYNGANSGPGVQKGLGDEASYDHCPNSAVLIVLPKYRTSFISSPTCEFFCANRGGQLVTAKVNELLRDDRVEEALIAGIAEIRSLLDITYPRSLEAPTSSHHIKMPLDEKLVKAEWVWKVGLRIIAVIVTAFTGVMLIAFIQQILTQPEDDTSRRLLGLGGMNKPREKLTFGDSEA